MTDGRVASRPRTDRATELVAAAATLVAERGYHAVGIDDIGGALGLSGPALYRHYRTKEAVVVAALREALRAWIEPVEDALSAAEPGKSQLRALVRASVEQMIDRRHEMVLLFREAEHVDPATLADVVEELRVGTERRVAIAREARPDLDRANALFLLYAIKGLLLGGVAAQPPPRRTRLVSVLTHAAVAVFEQYRPQERGATPTRNRPRREADVGPSRREHLLAAAVRMFRERGYGGLSLADVADAAGVTRSGLYQHFATKADLLSAALNRCAELLASASWVALADASTPHGALERLIAAHVDLAASHPDLVALYLSESPYLPLEDFPEFERARKAYVDDWVRVLALVDPTPKPAELRVLVHGAFGLVAECSALEYFTVGGRVAAMASEEPTVAGRVVAMRAMAKHALLAVSAGTGRG